MAACVKALVREALEAYVSCDLSRVQRAIEMDDQIDDYYDRIFTQLLHQIESDPTVLRAQLAVTRKAETDAALGQRVVTDEAVWMGVPLPAEGRSPGVLVIQSYSVDHRYSGAADRGGGAVAAPAAKAS
jgi:hypothetical protein